MRRILVSLLLLCSLAAFGQGVRVDNFTDTTVAIQSIGQTVFVPVPNSTINFCNSPATIVSGVCTNKAQTYTDATLGTPCSTSTQIVLAGTSSCVATTDGQGNWGVWVPTGQYQYTVTSGTTNYGPFPVTVTSINSPAVVRADTLQGADGGAKIMAAVALLPSTGGIVDATGLYGAQNWATASNFNKNGVTVLFGQSTWKITAQVTVSYSQNKFLGMGNSTILQFWGVPGFQITGQSVTIDSMELDSYSGGGSANPNTQIGIETQGTAIAQVYRFNARNLLMNGWLTPIRWDYTWHSNIYNVDAENGSNGVELFGQSVSDNITDSFFVSNGAAGSAGLKLTKDGTTHGEGLTVKARCSSGLTTASILPVVDRSFCCNSTAIRSISPR